MNLASSIEGIVRAVQREKTPFQSPVYPSGSRTPTQVMQDQAANAIKGIPQAVTGLPSAAGGAAQAFMDMITGQGSSKAQDIIKGILQPVATSVRGAAALAAPDSVTAPSDDEFAQAAQGAGANLGSVLLGEGAMKAAGPVGDFMDIIKKKIPSAARAGAKLDVVKGAAGDIPIDLTEAQIPVERAQELRQRGSSMPKVLNDFRRNRNALTGSPEFADQMTYTEGRDFASNAGRLSADETSRMTPPMQAQVSQFAKAMKAANREAAEKVGMGELYDEAMKEYRQAKTIEDATDVLKKWAVKAAIVGGAYELGKHEIAKIVMPR